jgi:uncharacterized protein YjbI with pentapeptide repeats
MANAEHEARLLSDVEGWNHWRANYAGAPDLSGAVFEDEDFTGADFSHVDLQRATFRDCVLISASFESAKLQGTNFSGITRADHVDFSRAVMNGARLTRCEWRNACLSDTYLVRSCMEESKFCDCDFLLAKLMNAGWYDCFLDGCELIGANLSDCCFVPSTSGSSEHANKMSQCTLTNANLAGADLRGVAGYQFDHNHIRGALVAPRATDEWSVLRRTYTGSRLIFNLIFLACFFAPVLAKVVFWMEVSRLETQLPVMLSTINQLSDALDATSGQVGKDMAQALRGAVAGVPVLRSEPRVPVSIALDQIVPEWLGARLMMHDKGTVANLLGASFESYLAGSSPARNARQLIDYLADELARRPEAEARTMADALRRSAVALPAHLPRPSSLLIAVILGLDVPWTQAGISAILGAVAGILLIVYNGARGLLTFFVTQLRDEEEVTDHTPRRQWSSLWVSSEAGGAANSPRPAALGRSYWVALRHLPRALRESYAWLVLPQRIVSSLQYLAYAMTAVHIYTAVTGTVVLPT